MTVASKAASKLIESCIFCKIIRGEIKCKKLFETEKTLAFLDVQPLSQGHTLIIPKYHGERLTDVPASHLSELLPVASHLAKQLLPHVDADDFNILQNNGPDAHQQVPHVHVHLIPKPRNDLTAGLGVGWPDGKIDEEKASAFLKALNEAEDWKADLRRELGVDEPAKREEKI